ncbi:MAG: malate/lactate/ureidoglycolate dehydrogenase [Alphaproteobacteria bacterium]|jgi:uncharacterized oxidoreductase|nr:malate/lactate/ureidoglycolate dehydrogenase [Alphaproteobacteria bacterium]
MPVTISAEKLTQLLKTMCRRSGSDESEAEAVARNLVEANLMGHDSHGVGLIPRYIEHTMDGRVTIDGHASVLSDTGAFLLLEGNMGYGQVVGREAMEMGLAKAREHGVAIVGLKNVHHLGRIGAWGEICAEAGFISIHYVNAHGHAALVAPFGGYDARYSTNPYCTALPATPENPMLVLDMATSRVAQGKVRVAYYRKAEMMAGALVGPDGRPTNDPTVMFEEPKGALLSFGEHKGYGLALICDILAGALTGGGTAHPENHQENTIRNNMLTIIIDPDGFRQGVPFDREIDMLTAWVKDSRTVDGVDGVLVPGEPERLSSAARLADGVPIEDATWAEIVEAGLSVGMNKVDFEDV